ncbi:MAG: DUF2961 domain-containing protein [Chloroflexota bacterium]|jgi:hypothetical protein|nr:DUF2961 domain-containing protein [Chloroflexota bacterium]
MAGFNGLGMNLGNLSRLSDAVTRSISAENPTGAKGDGGKATEGYGANAARDLGQGWKVAPAVWIQPGETLTMAEIEGPGAIQSIWLAGRTIRRECILRIYWDGQEQPSVECPLGDFFAVGWGVFAQVNSIPVSVNPNNGVNCYWEMPFRESCRITVENRAGDQVPCYYQVNYTLTEVPEDAAYFHAQFRRNNPLPYMEDHTIVDGIKGKGHFIGTAMSWGANNNNWWGEGEVKFFMDGDGEFPTICGTGLEDYFGGAYDWDVDGNYVSYSTPYLGMHQVIRGGKTYRANQRFSMYRWHVMDPIRFAEDLRVTIQALGWRTDPDRRYLPLQDDISSVAYWYQTLPTAPFPELPDRDYLEII